MATSSSRSSALTCAGVAAAEHLDAGPEALDELHGRRDPDVSGEQRLLDLLPGVLVDPRAGEQREQPAPERRLRAGQPGAEPYQPSLGRLRRLDAWLDDPIRVEQLAGRRFRAGLDGPAWGSRHRVVVDLWPGRRAVPDVRGGAFGSRRRRAGASNAAPAITPRSTTPMRTNTIGSTGRVSQTADHPPSAVRPHARGGLVSRLAPLAPQPARTDVVG